MFEVICDHDKQAAGKEIGRTFKTFRWAESYAKTVVHLSPEIWSGGKKLASVSGDASGHVWVDLTIEGCQYA